MKIYENFSKQILKSPKVVNIESDASSATYFLAAAAIGGGSLRVNGLGSQSIQGDIQFVKIREHYFLTFVVFR